MRYKGEWVVSKKDGIVTTEWLNYFNQRMISQTLFVALIPELRLISVCGTPICANAYHRLDATESLIGLRRIIALVFGLLRAAAEGKSPRLVHELDSGTC